MCSAPWSCSASCRGEQLVNSVAPFSDAARLMWGAWGAGAVAIAVIISSIGALNGWTLMMGQVPMAAAQDGVFPPVFGRLSARGVPAVGIVLSAVLATGLVAFQALGSPGVRAFYNLVVSLSTMAAVIPYAFCALAAGLVAARAAGSAERRCRASPWSKSSPSSSRCSPSTAAVRRPCLYGLLLLLLGIPVYVWQRQRSQSFTHLE